MQHSAFELNVQNKYQELCSNCMIADWKACLIFQDEFQLRSGDVYFFKDWY